MKKPALAAGFFVLGGVTLGWAFSPPFAQETMLNLAPLGLAALGANLRRREGLRSPGFSPGTTRLQRASVLTATPGKSVMMLSTPKSARRRIRAGSFTVHTDTCSPCFCAFCRRSGVHRVQFSASRLQP